MIVKYLRDKEKADASQNWSSTMGRITKSYMRNEVSYESGNTLYYPEVEYEYEFFGIFYTGHQINFGGSSGNSSRGISQKTLAQYPLDKNVKVYYDPNNPEEAVLERKMGMGGTVFLIVGILFILVALCALCIGGVIATVGFMGY